MNRLELLTLAIILVAIAIICVKSKRFDAFLDWVGRGVKPTTADDIKKAATKVDEAKERIRKDLAEAAKRAEADLKNL